MFRKKNQERIEEHEAKRHGVGIKAILARAMSGSIFYHWNVHFPLYRLLLLSRPHGSIQATTESCGKVAKMRKFPKFFEESINLGKQTDSRDLDIALVKAVHKKYCDTVAPRKKRDCTRQENFKRRHARGSKYNNGRMHEPGSPLWEENIIFFREVVAENAFDGVMTHLTPGEVGMCMDVLRFAEIPDIDTRTVEHFMPTWCEHEINSIVERLKPLVDRKDVAAFSWGLAGMDAVMNAILRPQDLLGMIAAHIYMMTDRAPTGEVADVIEATLPLLYKNDHASNASLEGGECCHIKDPRMHKWLVVMLVILRPLMREHLKDLHRERSKSDPDVEEFELCDELGPFDKNGKCFTVGKLQGLFQYLGKHLIALPHWGYNILRTSSMTDSAFLALAQNEGVDAPWILRKLQACRMSKHQYLRHYNAVVPRALRCDPNSMDSRAAGIDGLHRLRAERNAGSSGDSSEASRVELVKARDELEKARAETRQLLQEMDQKRKRIGQLEKENAQLSKEVEERSEGIRQPEPENEQPMPRTDGLRKELGDEQPEESSVGKKRKAGDVEQKQKRKKQAGLGSGSGGGKGKDGRVRPIRPHDLELAREGHGCLKKMYAQVDLSVAHKKPSFGYSVANGSVNSDTSPFSESVKAKFQEEHSELAVRFYKTFSKRSQLKPYYKELGLNKL